MRPEPLVAGVEANGRRLPPYVEHGGEIVYRPPYFARDVLFYGFVIQADRIAIDRYCERLFNKPSGGRERWRGASDCVLLNFVNTPTLGSTDRLDRELGVAAEREVAVWIPIIDMKRLRFAWAIGYMFVDIGMAMAAGREVYGYPKQLGSVHVPRMSPDCLYVDALTFLHFGPNEAPAMHRVITAETPLAIEGLPGPPLETRWHDPLEAVQAMTFLLLDPAARRPPPQTSAATLASAAVGSFAERLRHPGQSESLQLAAPELGMLFFDCISLGTLSMTLLKQFRDATYPTSACYQEINEIANTVTAFRGGDFLPDDYVVTFAELASEPFGRELGIAPLVQSPRVTFWLKFDFTTGLQSVLWRSGRA